jgi:hypothetical protein
MRSDQDISATPDFGIGFGSRRCTEDIGVSDQMQTMVPPTTRHPAQLIPGIALNPKLG